MRLNADGRFLISLVESEYDLDATITDAGKAIRRYVKTPLNNNQYSALVSLITSIGVEEFRASKLLKFLNDKDLHKRLKAAKQFHAFVYYRGEHGKTVDPFLVEQRKREVSLYLTPEVV